MFIVIIKKLLAQLAPIPVCLLSLVPSFPYSPIMSLVYALCCICTGLNILFLFVVMMAAIKSKVVQVWQNWRQSLLNLPNETHAGESHFFAAVIVLVLSCMCNLDLNLVIRSGWGEFIYYVGCPFASFIIIHVLKYKKLKKHISVFGNFVLSFICASTLYPNFMLPLKDNMAFVGLWFVLNIILAMFQLLFNYQRAEKIKKARRVALLEKRYKYNYCHFLKPDW